MQTLYPPTPSCYLSIANELQRIEINSDTVSHADLQSTHKTS
jgi:hypothetical protein